MQFHQRNPRAKFLISKRILRVLAIVGASGLTLVTRVLRQNASARRCASVADNKL